MCAVASRLEPPNAGIVYTACSTPDSFPFAQPVGGQSRKVKKLEQSDFRSFRNYRIRILFFCGKLNFYSL